MSKKTKKNVQSAKVTRLDDADEPQPAQAAQPAEPAPAAQAVAPPATQAAPQAERVSIIDVAKAISEEKVQAAEMMGIPIRPLMKWAIAIERTVIEQNKALEQLGVKLEPLISLAQRAQQAQGGNPNSAATPAPSAGAGGLGQIMNLISSFLPKEGGESGLSKQIVDSIVTNALSDMNAAREFNKTFQNYVLQRIAMDTAHKVIP